MNINQSPQLSSEVQHRLAEMNSAIAEVLINKRERYGMSQKDISRIYHIDLDKVIAIENMEYDFRLSELVEILHDFNIKFVAQIGNIPIL